MTKSNESTKNELITDLINDKKTQFTEADRDWLMKLPEENIQKLFPTNGSIKRYTWMDAASDALKQHQPKTMAAWAGRANEKYVEKGGKENKETALNSCKMVADVLSRFPIDIEIPAK